MQIDFLFFADCPSHVQALQRLNQVLDDLHLRPEVSIREVKTEDEARELSFIGSPTIRIDGEDIDPEGLAGETPGLSCRIYRLEDGRISPLPSTDMIYRAVRKKTQPAGRRGDKAL